MELLGEEIDTKVAMLPSLCRGSDPNDLARTALKDQEIADADMVAWDSDGMSRHVAFDNADILTDTFTDASGAALLVHDDFLTIVMAVMLLMEGVENPVSGFFDAVAEGMVVAFVVVVTHLGSVPW